MAVRSERRVSKKGIEREGGRGRERKVTNEYGKDGRQNDGGRK